MCNILTYYFTCHHSLRRLRSRCSGTKHKPATSSTPAKAACTALSYLCICLRMECGACQHQAWEDAWKLKLARARSFLAKIQGKNMPGAEDIAKLVNDLEEAYTIESWKTRNMFANVPKPRISRVQHTRYQRTSSKLKQEVAPEDVVEKIAGKDWSELNEEDYDGDYVASTDPLHPVNTTYDSLWAQEYPGGCEDEQATDGKEEEGGSWNENDSGWDWGDGSSDGDNTAEVAHEGWHAEEATTENIDKETPWMITKPQAGLTAWGPEADLSISTSMIRIDDQNAAEEQNQRAARIKELAQTFWSIVNRDISNADQISHPLQNDNIPDASNHDTAISSVSEAYHVKKNPSTKTNSTTTTTTTVLLNKLAISSAPDDAN